MKFVRHMDMNNTIRCLNIKCWKMRPKGKSCIYCGQELSASAPAYFKALNELEPLRYEYLEQCKRMAYARSFKKNKRSAV